MGVVEKKGTPQDLQLEERFRALPPEAQRQILDFMAFLEQRYRFTSHRRHKKPLQSYAFVGLWRERKDMENSEQWVRAIRRQEWRG